MSTSAQASKGMELTDVPPPIRPTLNVVFGSLRDLELGDHRDGAAEGVDRDSPGRSAP